MIAFNKYFKKLHILFKLNILFNDIKKVPDIAIYRKWLHPENDEINATKPPLCAIGILSPKQNLSELLTKSQLYFDNGVQSYWLVIPDLETVYVFN